MLLMVTRVVTGMVTHGNAFHVWMFEVYLIKVQLQPLTHEVAQLSR